MSESKNSTALDHTPTRRQVIAGGAMALGGIAFGSRKAWAGAEDEISRTAESIHQEPVFSEPEARLRSTDKYQTVRQDHTA
jgi:hypothetical protein